MAVFPLIGLPMGWARSQKKKKNFDPVKKTLRLVQNPGLAGWYGQH